MPDTQPPDRTPKNPPVPPEVIQAWEHAHRCPWAGRQTDWRGPLVEYPDEAGWARSALEEVILRPPAKPKTRVKIRVPGHRKHIEAWRSERLEVRYLYGPMMWVSARHPGQIHTLVTWDIWYVCPKVRKVVCCRVTTSTVKTWRYSAANLAILPPGLKYVPKAPKRKKARHDSKHGATQEHVELHHPNSSS